MQDRSMQSCIICYIGPAHKSMIPASSAVVQVAESDHGKQTHVWVNMWHVLMIGADFTGHVSTEMTYAP